MPEERPLVIAVTNPIQEDSKNNIAVAPTTTSEQRHRRRSRKLRRQRKSSERRHSSSNSEELSSSTELDMSNETHENKSTPDICVIGADAFHMATKQPGTDVFAISVRYIEEYDQKRTSDTANSKDSLPTEFHEFTDVFSKEGSNKLSPHRPFDHKIELTKELSSLRTEPFRRTTQPENEAIREYIAEYLAKDWIRPSSASYASPILFVKKPGGGIRLCVDYRKLNEITKKDKYPLPLIEETLTRVLKANWFSKIDIRQAFHRLRMATEGDEELTTFMTRFGNYAYKVLPFGLCGGPASFQRFMNESFMDVLDKYVSIYLDDILIYSNTREEHTEHIRFVLQRPPRNRYRSRYPEM